jgi:hypothetical protein
MLSISHRFLRFYSSHRGLNIVALVLGLASFVAGVSRADAIYLRDGTVLYGRVTQNRTVFNDPATGMPVVVPAGDGVFSVYDGTRSVAFSRSQIDPSRGNLGVDAIDIYAKLMHVNRPAQLPSAKCPAGQIKDRPAFNAKGERMLRVWLVMGGFIDVGQRITFLSPYQMRIFSTTHQWVQNFLTSELDRDMVISFIKNFPQIHDLKDPVEKGFLLVRFMIESKWYDLANKELDSLEKDHPASKEAVEKMRERLRLLEIDLLLDETQRALSAGQIRGAQAMLGRITNPAADAPINVRINEIRVRVDKLSKRFDSAMRFLRILPDDAQGKCAEILCEAASVIRDELYLEALDRLEPFVDLSEQAERIKKQGGTPPDSAEQLLARAVTGWLLGKESSDARPEVARKLWKAREMAASYIRTPELRDRNSLRQLYEKDEPVEVEELARIIALLPPPIPDQNVQKVLIKQDTLVRKTSLPNNSRVPSDYEVLLPPEYRPGRPYPVLFVLHQEGESLRTTIQRYAVDALQNGYILVAAEWGTGFGGAYRYSDEEQQRVLDVIRDVRLRFHVDSDRVFLSGYGEGGNAAWDIGLSHPDLFAAVVPIASNPRKSIILNYWPNAAHLPFYVVVGELGGDSVPTVLKVMENWINKGYQCLHVAYQGRGMEWFAGELPLAFDWMNRRKRIEPFPEIGRWPASSKDTALQTARTTDNHFYWLTADEIRDSNRIDVKGTDVVPARLQAIIRPGNKIEVSSFGLKKLTVWLGPGMIDYTKPVSIKLSGYVDFPTPFLPNGSKPLKPDLSIMMEDFLERGDNTHLFVNKISLNPQKPPKTP